MYIVYVIVRFGLMIINLFISIEFFLKLFKIEVSFKIFMYGIGIRSSY